MSQIVKSPESEDLRTLCEGEEARAAPPQEVGESAEDVAMMEADEDPCAVDAEGDDGAEALNDFEEEERERLEANLLEAESLRDTHPKCVAAMAGHLSEREVGGLTIDRLRRHSLTVADIILQIETLRAEGEPESDPEEEMEVDVGEGPPPKRARPAAGYYVDPEEEEEDAEEEEDEDDEEWKEEEEEEEVAEEKAEGEAEGDDDECDGSESESLDEEDEEEEDDDECYEFAWQEWFADESTQKDIKALVEEVHADPHFCDECKNLLRRSDDVWACVLYENLLA